MELEEYGYREVESPDGSGAASDSDMMDLQPAELLRYYPGSRYSETRAFGWMFSSAVAIYTTKRLLVVHNYHYPATIAVRTFESLLLVYVLALSWRFISSHRQKDESSRLGRLKPTWLGLLPTRIWRGMMPASFLAAISVPMLFQALLHMPSLPVLVMLFPLIYAVESIVLFIHHSFLPLQQKYTETPSLTRAMIICVASAVILYNEYRLMVPGIVWSIIGYSCMGAARALFIMRLTGTRNDDSVQDMSCHAFISMAILFGLISSTIISTGFEPLVDSDMPWSTLVLVLVNQLSLLAAFFGGSSLLVYSPISVAQVQSFTCCLSNLGNGFFASIGSSLLLLVAAIHSQRTTVVSNVQIVAYVVASGCLLSTESLQLMVARIMALPSLIRGNSSTQKPSYMFTIGGTFFCGLIVALLLFMFEASALASLSSHQPKSLDKSYNTSSSPFDIVVSAYIEDPESIRNMLQSIKSTSFLSQVNTRVILYIKFPNADLPALKHSTGADIVLQHENIGREGETYLHHIVTNWDTLAEKTMFIQAHAHNVREIIPRIDSYLVPETGMLSLGFTGVTCDCLSCGDRFGWKDSQHVISDVYARIYHQTCRPNTSILLTYKGQFVASARRIRGVSKDIYEDLLHGITSAGGWTPGGADVNVEEREDSANNPLFGFTLERLWGLVLQCGRDSSIAARCPSLLSGKGMGGSIGDCQCLDLLE